MSKVPKDYIGGLPSDPQFTPGFTDQDLNGGYWGQIPTSTYRDANGKVVQRFKNPTTLSTAQTNCTAEHSRFAGVMMDVELGPETVEALAAAQKVVREWPGNSSMPDPVRVALRTDAQYTEAKAIADGGGTPSSSLRVYWDNIQLANEALEGLMETFRFHPLDTFLLNPLVALGKYQEGMVKRGIAVYQYNDEGEIISGLIPQLSQSSVATENAKLLAQLVESMKSPDVNPTLAKGVEERLKRHFQNP